MLSDQDHSRLTSMLAGTSTISDLVFPKKELLLEVFSTFVKDINTAQFPRSLPWEQILNCPNLLLRSEMLQSPTLKLGINALMGKASVGREIASSTTVTGEL